jgi:hypothetical protein
MAIWQDVVDDHGFTARYASVRRFVHWRVVDARVLDVTVVSDHRPVLVVMELTEG